MAAKHAAANLRATIAAQGSYIAAYERLVERQHLEAGAGRPLRARLTGAAALRARRAYRAEAIDPIPRPPNHCACDACLAYLTRSAHS